MEGWVTPKWFDSEMPFFARYARFAVFEVSGVLPPVYQLRYALTVTGSEVIVGVLQPDDCKTVKGLALHQFRRRMTASSCCQSQKPENHGRKHGCATMKGAYRK
jgi:hypothetical protein